MIRPLRFKKFVLKGKTSVTFLNKIIITETSKPFNLYRDEIQFSSMKQNSLYSCIRCPLLLHLHPISAQIASEFLHFSSFIFSV